MRIRSGSELPEDRQRDGVEHAFEIGVGGPGRQRQVHGEPGARAAADLAGGAGARVERVLMRRDEEHGRVVEERPLRAVAVVDVVVHHRHAGKACRASVGRGDGDVAVEAEPHRAIALRMVSGRAHQGQRAAARGSLQHAIDSVHPGAGREPGHVHGVGGGVGVGIERHRPSRGGFDGRQVLRAVHARQFVRASGTRLCHCHAPGTAIRRDAGQHLGPGGPLEVSGRRQVIEKPARRQDRQAHAH